MYSVTKRFAVKRLYALIAVACAAALFAMPSASQAKNYTFTLGKYELTVCFSNGKWCGNMLVISQSESSEDDEDDSQTSGSIPTDQAP